MKRKIKRRLLGAFLAVSICMASGGVICYANAGLTMEPVPFDSAEIDAYSPVAVREAIVYEGQQNNLYPTFESQSDALNALKEEQADILEQIAGEKNLAELSNDNWEQYYAAAGSFSGADSDEASLLLKFFDIYENADANREIKEVLAQSQSPPFFDEPRRKGGDKGGAGGAAPHYRALGAGVQ